MQGLCYGISPAFQSRIFHYSQPSRLLHTLHRIDDTTAMVYGHCLADGRRKEKISHVSQFWIGIRMTDVLHTVHSSQLYFNTVLLDPRRNREINEIGEISWWCHLARDGQCANLAIPSILYIPRRIGKNTLHDERQHQMWPPNSLQSDNLTIEMDTSTESNRNYFCLRSVVIMDPNFYCSYFIQLGRF